MICPSWGIAGVNLSIGYRDEHSVSEVLFVGAMLNTIDKVVKMLSEKKIPTFKYIACKKENIWYRKWLMQPATDHCKCTKCNKKFESVELIPAKTPDFKWRYYCPDCLTNSVDWCACCGEAFEVPSDGAKMGLCEDCYYDMYYARTTE